MIFLVVPCVLGAAEPAVNLYALFVRPEKNPLEVYPCSRLPLCICNPLPGFDQVADSKCKRMLMRVSKVTRGRWCTSPLDEQKRGTLAELLAQKYELGFESGSGMAVSKLGPDNSSVYSHMLFKFVDTTLVRVVPSKPVNLNTSGINFTYEVNFVGYEPPAHRHVSIGKFCLFCYVLFVALFVFLVKPELCAKPTVQVLATIPSYNFLVVVLSGAGAGAYFFVVALILMYFMHIDVTASWWKGFGIPGTMSSVATGCVTSLICSLLRLKDVASALYFAPLLFPSIVLAILFSVQWIPICVGSCLTLPMKAIFAFLIVSVFVKLPINLIAGLVTGSVCRPVPYVSLRSVNVRCLLPSRRLFLTIANFLLFCVAYPLVRHLLRGFSVGIDGRDWTMLVAYMPLWILSSVCVGLASMAMADAVDWAVFAFMSSAGCGVMTWVVTMIYSAMFDGMTGTLQLSMHAAILSLLCIGLSLSGGCISVLAVVVWLIGTGKPSKNS